MTAVPTGLVDHEAPVPGHIGLIHASHAERRAWQLAFLRVAFADPAQGAVLFGAPGVAAQLKRDLEGGLGRTLEGEVLRGKLVLIESDTDADVCLERIRDAVAGLSARGYAIARVSCRCTWSVPGFPAPEDQLWLESRVHSFVTSSQAIFLCAYDLTVLPGSALAYGCLESHPQIVLGGQLIDNPSFVEPDRYFAERLLRLPWLMPP